MKNGLSIIIPVYNVKQYLDKCMDSVINQTDDRFEVILVNDGSTDGSDEICKHWAGLYDHIKYIEQENMGLGPARMRGITEAEYTFFTFLDSDDWIDADFVASMLDLTDKSDLIYCDAVYVDENENYIRTDFFRSNMQRINADVYARLLLGYPNMWGCVYRKDIWEKNCIKIPAVIYEDSASYIQILNAYKNINCTSKTKYYYRMGRKNGLMYRGRRNPQLFINALTILIDYSVEKGIFKLYEHGLEAFCVRQLEFEWEKVINHQSDYSENDAKRAISDFLDNKFDGWRKIYDLNYVAIGSYNTCAVFNRIKLFRELQRNKYQFASLIDIFECSLDNKKGYSYRHTNNSYRKRMVEKILKKEFFEDMNDDSVVIVDLLTESTDLIKVGEGYITKSDALVDSVDIYGHIEIIPWFDERRFIIWKKACKKFSEYVKNNNNKVYLLEIYFSYKYGNEESRYSYYDVTEIEKRNKCLKEYYHFFEANVPNVKKICLDDFYSFTDEKFKYGCSPEHLNDFAYYLLAKGIVDSMLAEGRN